MNDAALKEFISTFSFLQRFDCFPAIDAMFKKMIDEDWSQESLETNKLLIVTFCRINFLFRDRLPHYEPFLQKSITYLQNQNIDPSSLLKGII